MNELILLGSGFGVVFALGFQSLNVNGGHYILAFCTSFLIGAFNLALYKLAPHAQTVPEIACYLVGGPIGIICAMWVHRHVVAPRMKHRAEPRTGTSPQEDRPGDVPRS